MTKTSEEKYPLLLLYVEENGRKSEFPQRVVFADKGRAQMTSCWLTSIALGTAFVFISLLLLLSSFNSLSFPLHLRCTREIKNANQTIHLVKFGDDWTHKQLDILKFIAETYPHFEIRNIILDSSLENVKKIEVKKNNFLPDFTGNFVKKLNEILRSPYDKNNTRSVHLINLSDNYKNILKTYPNIKEKIYNYKEYFASTPLHYFWVDLSPDILMFSVRVLELWQNGGISFYLPVHDHQLTNTTVLLNKTNIIKPSKNNFNMTKLKILIANTKLRYEKLGDDLVSVDGQGLHMATKTPCHAFFGEMILKLQKDNFSSVPEIIQRILGVFCGRGAVDSDYCNKK